MSQTIELNQGEVKINFSSQTSGKATLAELGLKDENLAFENGLIRLVFNMDEIAEPNYFQVPTIEIAYHEEMGETHWQCDFNKNTILDKTDHHGHSTVLLLNRNILSELENRHKNALIIHGEFPQPVKVSAENSFIILFN